MTTDVVVCEAALRQALTESLNGGSLDETRALAVRYAEIAAPQKTMLADALQLLSKAGCWEGILQCVERQKYEWSDEPTVLRIVARAERALGLYDQAIAHHRLELSLTDIPAARHELALTLEKAGRLSEAVDCWRDLSEREPASPRWIAYYARALRMNGQDETAESILKEALLRHPGRDDIQHRYGNLLMKRSDFNGAANAFAMASKIKPSERKYILDLMKAVNGTSDEALLRDAAKRAEAYLDVAGADEDVVVHALKIYSRLSVGEDLTGRMMSLTSRYLDSPRVLRILAPELLRCGLPEKAQAILERHLTLEPSNREVLYGLAGILAQQSHVEAALSLLMKHGPEGDSDAVFPARVGHLLVWSDKVDEAMSWLKKAALLDPLNPTVFADMCNCFERQGRLGSAAAALDQALVLSLTASAKPPVGFADADLSTLQIKKRMLCLSFGEIGKARALLEETHRGGTRSGDVFKVDYPVRDWHGEPLESKRVLAIAGAGLGDEIRATSVFARLLSRSSEILVTCEPRLESLLTRSFPGFTFFPTSRPFARLKQRRDELRSLARNEFTRRHLSDAAIKAGQGADYWVRLPYAFNLEILDNPKDCLSSSPATIVPDPKLRADYSEEIRSRIGDAPLVGLSWRSGHNAYNRDQLYLSVQQLKPMLGLTQSCFTVINYTYENWEIEFLRSVLGTRLVEFPEIDLMNDIEAVAALCSNLDVAVCVDTSVLDIAASVGTPTLYLMRAPLIFQRYRMLERRHDDGTYADRIWPNCRILPRRNSNDKDLVDRARAILAQHLDSGTRGNGAW